MSEVMQPGPRCVGRLFATEEEAAEATECPLTHYLPDGTVCDGPGCRYWQSIPVDTNDPTNPTRVHCTANGKIEHIGTLRRELPAAIGQARRS
jgi:hypothetical protein